MSLFINWSNDDHVDEVIVKNSDAPEGYPWSASASSTSSLSAALDGHTEDPYPVHSTATVPAFSASSTHLDGPLSTSAWPGHLTEILVPINTQQPVVASAEHPDSPVKIFEGNVRHFATLPVDNAEVTDDGPQTSSCCICGHQVDRIGLQDHVQNCFVTRQKTEKTKTPSPAPQKVSPPSSPKHVTTAAGLERLLPLVAQLPLEQRIHMMQALTRLSHVANKTLSPVLGSSGTMSPKATPQDEQILQLIYRTDSSPSPPPLRLLGDCSPSSSSESEDKPFPEFALPGSAFNLVDDTDSELSVYGSPYSPNSYSRSDSPPALDREPMVKLEPLAHTPTTTPLARPVRGSRFTSSSSSPGLSTASSADAAARPLTRPSREATKQASRAAFVTKRKRLDTAESWSRAMRVKQEPLE